MTTLVATLGALAVAISGCGASAKKADPGINSVVGARKQFVATCGLCHTLADAKTNGAVGPNLDDLQPGRETVLAQINDARGGMPSALLHGNDAEQVARYVATYAGK